MHILKSKYFYYSLASLAIIARIAIDGVNISSAIIILGILAFEAYSKYLENIKVKDLNKELESRVSSLESKFSLVSTRR